MLQYQALPRLISQQYILSSVVDERADVVVYEGRQKDMQREVIVHGLRHSSAADPEKLKFFMDTAAIQAHLKHPNIAAPLEMFEAEGTWFVVYERIKGEPLDMMVSTGRVLSTEMLCSLLLQLCHLCQYFDIARIASMPFSLEHTYLMDFVGFRFDNMAQAGFRASDATRVFLGDAATKILPLVNRNSPLSAHLVLLLTHMRAGGGWNPLTAVYLGEELVRFQMEIIHRREQHQPS